MSLSPTYQLEQAQGIDIFNSTGNWKLTVSVFEFSVTGAPYGSRIVPLFFLTKGFSTVETLRFVYYAALFIVRVAKAKIAICSVSWQLGHSESGAQNFAVKVFDEDKYADYLKVCTILCRHNQMQLVQLG